MISPEEKNKRLKKTLNRPIQSKPLTTRDPTPDPIVSPTPGVTPKRATASITGARTPQQKGGFENRFEDGALAGRYGSKGYYPMQEETYYAKGDEIPKGKTRGDIKSPRGLGEFVQYPDANREVERFPDGSPKVGITPMGRGYGQTIFQRDDGTFTNIGDSTTGRKITDDSGQFKRELMSFNGKPPEAEQRLATIEEKIQQATSKSKRQKEIDTFDPDVAFKQTEIPQPVTETKTARPKRKAFADVTGEELPTLAELTESGGLGRQSIFRAPWERYKGKLEASRPLTTRKKSPKDLLFNR